MRLIDADELMNGFAELVNNKNLIFMTASQVMEMLDKVPTVDTEKHGHWIIHEKWHKHKRYIVCECSACGKSSGGNYKTTPYCSMCGAKMDEVSEDGN